MTETGVMLRRTIAACVFGAFSLLALLILLTMSQIMREHAISRTVQRTLINQRQIFKLYTTIGQADLGARDYLALGTPASRALYENAAANIQPELDEFDANAGSTSDGAKINGLNHLVTAEMAQLAEAVALTTSGYKTQAVALIGRVIDGKTHPALRQMVASLQNDEERRLLLASAGEAQADLLLQIVTISTAISLFFVALYVTLYSRSRNAQMRRAEAALIDANNNLERVVSERGVSLSASEAQFRALMEFMPNGVAIADAKGALTFTSAGMARFTGVSVQEMRGDGWLALLHPDDREVCTQEWYRRIALGEDFSMEYRIRHHGGLYRWFLVTNMPYRDSQGRIIGWVGTVADIDKRHRAEAETAHKIAWLEDFVADRMQALDQFFALSQDILIITNFDLQTIAVNPAWQRITGHSAAKLMTSQFRDFVHPDDMGPNLLASREILLGKAEKFDVRFRRADGAWSWLSWTVMASPERGLVYAIGRDTTAAREREAQLRQSQKMEVVGQLTGGLAHDFNNLLTIIMGSLELLQNGLKNANPQIMRRLVTAMDAARRAAVLTHRMLAFSRLQPLDPTPLDANTLLEGMGDILNRSLGEVIEVKTHNMSGLWPVLVDANQLENAILNLAVNARDAMPEGGTLIIKTQNIELDASSIQTIPGGHPGPYVAITVQDTGTGMTPDVQAKVFEPFFTTKPAGQGTGLGLAQVYGFITQSGGFVDINSAPGVGTSVTIYLPRLERAITPAAAPPPPSPYLARGHGEPILVVEDEPGVRQFAQDVLNELGYIVHIAGTGAEALRILGQSPIRLVFTDIVLAGEMTGRDLAEQVRNAHPDMPFLFTTGYNMLAPSDPAQDNGSIDFIGKPFTAALLGNKIAQLLARHRVMP
ncbi:MAG: PAS domain S-box protein [Acidocella sp.]|nr:PAS domain S-box protein [Acidocella sp.]